MTRLQIAHERHLAAALLFMKAKRDARDTMRAFRDELAIVRLMARTHLDTMALAVRMFVARMVTVTKRERTAHRIGVRS